MQWVQNTSQSNVDNLNNVRPEASRNLRGEKRKEYLKANLKLRVRPRLSESCIRASVTLRRVTSLELL